MRKKKSHSGPCVQQSRGRWLCSGLSLAHRTCPRGCCAPRQCYTHSSRSPAPGQRWLTRVLYAFLPSSCLSKGPVSLQPLLTPSKPRAAGEAGPSVYPLTCVLGFQVNVCDLCFLTRISSALIFFFFKNEMQKKIVL